MKFNLKKYSFIFFIISIIIQVLLVINFSGTQISDQALYLKLAKNSIEHNSFYPSLDNIYSNYIFAPGYVNYLSIILMIFRTTKSILFLNILLLLLIDLEIFYLAKKYFSINIAWLSLLIASFYSTYFGIVMYTSTELLFTSLAIGAVCLYTKEKLYYILIAGVLLGLANWVRPFLPVFIIVILLITLFIVNKKIVRFVFFSISLFITVFTIGFITYEKSGYFLYQSSTAGVNLIMGANDDADGSYNTTVFEKGNIGFVANLKQLTFKERNDYFQKAAFDWIISHPIKYLKLIPKKIFYMYAHDFHALAPLSGSMEFKAGSRNIIADTIYSFPNLAYIKWVMIYNQLYYFLILLFGCLGYRNTILSKNKFGIILGLIWILGSGLTIVAVGASRYHFPYMPILILFASVSISDFVEKKKKKLKINYEN